MVRRIKDDECETAAKVFEYNLDLQHATAIFFAKVFSYFYVLKSIVNIILGNLNVKLVLISSE